MALAKSGSARWIGYSDMVCDDPRGQFYNWRTRRAWIADLETGERIDPAPMLGREPDTWTQFAGWSPDGKTAIVLCLHEEESNYAWERANREFRHTQGWLVDTWLVDMASGAMHNPCAVDRVSNYNAGLFYWPGDATRVGFTPLIGRESRPFSMRLDGSDKRDLSSGAGFTYGYSASPDGKRISYHKSYQVYLADADGGNQVHVETGDEFHFGPLWSPDGKWLTFLAGTHGDCDLFLVGADGRNPRRLADRNGYVGWVETLDTPDFHSTSSDIPVWSPDSRWIYYTAQIGGAVELMRVSVEGAIEQLTRSAAGVMHYHPETAETGELLFGSTREGARALYASDARGGNVRVISPAEPGRAKLHAHWRPGGR